MSERWLLIRGRSGDAADIIPRLAAAADSGRVLKPGAAFSSKAGLFRFRKCAVWTFGGRP
jgi:hypothetical protein